MLETIESGLPAFRQTPNYDAARDIIFFGTSVARPVSTLARLRTPE
ncbi:hypothetical protein I551_5710 [Mycobacterium ulcerans str. Harvey]|uniref:Uncharacterized protein n=1 Tax=Mycobacterium ulcerans str. Harvey TaxID=1299332 RepID=A0ABP3AD33_MYCUL|nr:hypothetical protein I551_5710 [Mycobacterium ulcerans str. Harvey]